MRLNVCTLRCAPVICAGCRHGSDAEKSQDQQPLNDTEQHSSSMQSAECSYSAKCMTASESDEIGASIGAAEGPLVISNMVSGSCSRYSDVVTAGILSHSGTERAEVVSDSAGNCCSVEAYVATSNPVNSSAGPYSRHISTTDSSAAGPSQHSMSSTEVNSTGDKEQCSYDSVHKLSRECSNQSSIRSFFKPVSKGQQTGTDAHNVKKTGLSPLSNAHDVALRENTQVRVSFGRNVDSSHSLKTDANNVASNQSSGFTHKSRKCPFYKWIPGNVFCSFV